MSFERQRLARPHDGRLVAGVAAAIGDALCIDANVVRCGFLVLTLAGGIGALFYGAGWLLIPPVRADARPARASDPISTVAFSAVVFGVLLLTRAIGPWPGDVIVWPLGAAMVGLALLSTRGNVTHELPDWPFLERLPPEAADAVAVLVGTRRGALARIVVGTACIIAGLGAFFVSVDSFRALRGGVIGAAVVLVGIALVLGPGLWQLVNQLVSERRERIRSDERAEVAAHLHDSVLQTLALVQRRADDPREVVRLARMQERELRGWLLDGGVPQGSTAGASLGADLEEIAAAVETEHGVPVEVVRVRDCPADGMQPLLLAAREAMVNAVRHSGASSVAVYLEVEPRRVSIFVRDRGCGFDPATVAADRRGIAGSIVDRLARAGGTAEVRSVPGEGTEIEMSLPRTTEAVPT